MKNADKENQKRYTSVVASRAPGTEGQNEPAQPGGLDGKKNSGQRRSVFFLTPFMELTGHLDWHSQQLPNSVRDAMLLYSDSIRALGSYRQRGKLASEHQSPLVAIRRGT